MTRRRIGFTTRASCLLAAGVTAIVCGLVLGETDLLRVGVLAAVLPLAAAVVVHRSRLRIASRRRIEPRQVAAGQAVTVALTITNRAPWASGPLMLEDTLPDRFSGRARFVLDSLARGDERTVSYRLPELTRGRYRVGPLQVRRTDPFRMIELTRSFTSTTDFLVHPVVDDLPAGNPTRTDDPGDGGGSHSIGTHGAEDASTREYRTGDDLRKIHWRSSARTGSLMVRQEERPWRSQRSVLLDRREGAHAAAADRGPDPRDTDSFEWAVSATASIAAQALRSGRDVALLGDPTDTTDPTGVRPRRFSSRDELTLHLARVQPTAAARPDTLAAAVRTAARDGALVAVLGRLDAATAQLLAEAHPHGNAAPAWALLLDVDSWTTPDPADAGGDTLRAAAILRAGGWRTVTVRSGMSTLDAWRLLLAGDGATVTAR